MKLENNSVEVSGLIVTAPELKWLSGNKTEIYGFYLEVDRKSKKKDVLPVCIHKKHLDAVKEAFDKKTSIAVVGSFRSHTQTVEEKKSKLTLYIFADEIRQEAATLNSVDLIGYVGKDVVIRETPRGKKLAELMLTVVRVYNDIGISKSDFIPCIAFMQTAKASEKFNKGDLVKVHGRIQSRDYEKSVGEGIKEQHTVYEVVINRIETQEITK